MWWKMVLLAVYLVVLFALSRFLEAVAFYEGGYLTSRLLDPVSLSVRKLKTLLDQRGVSYAGVLEKQELTDLIDATGDVLEGEVEAASLPEPTPVSTYFSGGNHFYEEVEDTKDSVWVVQVIRNSRYTFMPDASWKTFQKKVSRFGVRTGIFDCAKDWALCDRKQWYTSRLIIALPQGYKHKDSVSLRSFTGPTDVQSVFNWVGSNLASRIKNVESFEELQKDWLNVNSTDAVKLRLLLFTDIGIPPMFLSVLSVKFSGRVNFGIVKTKSKNGQNIVKKLSISKVPQYCLITPENNYTYGMRSGEYKSFHSLALFLRTLHPEVNDLFLLSLLLVNVACWLEFFIRNGSLLKRLWCMLWVLGKWNILFISSWLPVLAILQLPYIQTVQDYSLYILRLVSMTEFACVIRSDWLFYTSLNLKFLPVTFLIFTTVVGLMYYFLAPPTEEPDNNNNTTSWWADFNVGSRWYLRSQTPWIPDASANQNLELENDLDMIIERLSLPNFYLRPMISSEYIHDLPVWQYSGPCVDSDFGSDFDCMSIGSDGEDAASGSESISSLSSGEHSRTPLMFICEKCRALQESRENAQKSAQELEEELLESESACAKYLMDGDYKCSCNHGEPRKKSPKKNKTKHKSGHKSKERLSDTEIANDEGPNSATSMPPGIIPSTECAICLTSYHEAALLCGLPCGHSFHQDCILKWLAQDNHICPLCRWPAYKAKPCSLHLHAE